MMPGAAERAIRMAFAAAERHAKPLSGFPRVVQNPDYTFQLLVCNQEGITYMNCKSLAVPGQQKSENRSVHQRKVQVQAL